MVTFCCFGAPLPLFFYPLIFSNYCHISSSTPLSPGKHVQFPFGKTLTVNVFRQRINQLFQGVEDIWRGIAKHSQWAIALHSLW
ncbi:hypothetical protein CEP14_14410 [Cylindrospermopsis raciborskii C04]|uniref:Transposase n=1 Tax=Cylindrospermopsis raciborskii C07 TaxID=2014886 RepID=A0ABX4WIJ3_9CYAN|nr:hypothetical protein CEP14_14410 [Cylindrospermopsis raciborskii C04]PNJ93270.1 hypothetical protein CEP15_14995 [Cylindrospermopsis raciborskii C07]